MQQSRPPHFPLCSSFIKHRSSISGSRFTIDHLILPKPLAAPVWASLPTPPMSGTPPPEPPYDPPQIAGRRRKRTDTPPTTTSVPQNSALLSPLDTRPSRPGPSPLLRAGGSVAEPALQTGPYGYNYPPPQTSYQPVPTVPSSTTSLPDPRFPIPQISPRTTRKPKAHVASACVNCKKKHLRCDSSRPCRRCVQSGKEESCVDVEHKKRGRPPLKPEGSSTSSYLTSPLTTSAASLGGPPNFPPGSAYAQPSYQPLAPSVPPSWNRGRLQGAPPFLPTPAQPSISASYQSAAGVFTPASSGLYPGRPPLLPGPLPMQYGMQPDIGRYGPYTNYFNPAMQGPPPQHQELRNPIFPREPARLPSQMAPSMQSPSTVQLPPILPAPIDPRIAQQSQLRMPPTSQITQARRVEESEERQAKRPKMDIQGILGPPRDK
jgi:hypothetical protein